MKKVTKLGTLLLGLVLAVGSLVGCGKTSSSSSSPDSTSSVDRTQEYQNIVSGAGSYVWSMYYQHDVIDKTDSFDVVTHTNYDGHDVQITWDLEITGGVTQDAVKYVVTEDADYDTIYVGYYDEKVTEDTTFKLTPTFTYEGVSKTLAEIVGADKGFFAYRTPKFALNTRAEWDAEGATGTNTMNIKGVVLDILGSGSSKGSFYFQDAAGNGYYAYLPTKNTAKVGDVVVVTGKRSDYSGQQEFGKNCTVHVYAGETQEVKVKDGSTDWATWTSAKNFTAEYQNNYVELKNCKATRVDGSNYYFKVGEGTTEYNIYDSYYFLSDAQRKEFKANFLALVETQRAFDLKGISTVYSNAIQVYGSTNFPAVVTGFTVDDEFKAAGALGEVAGKFAAAYTEDVEITLPTTGDVFNTPEITWAVVEPTDATLVSIADGKLKIKVDSSYDQIVIRATSKLGEAQKTKDITLETALTYTTVANFLTNKDKTNVQYLHGYVVAAGGSDTSEGSFVIDDGTGAVFSYEKFKVNLGDEVIVTTKYSEFNDFPQSDTTAVKVVSTGHNYTGKVQETIDKDNIGTIKTACETDLVTQITEYTGKLVKATGYLVETEDSKGNKYINLYATANDATSTRVAQLSYNDTIKTNDLDPKKGTTTEVDVYAYVRGLSKSGVTLQIQAVVDKGAAYAQTEVALLKLTANSFVGVTGYSKEAVDYSIYGHEVNLSKDVSYTFKNFGTLEYIQLKKALGTITIANEKPEQVVLTTYSTFDYAANDKQPVVKFGETTLTTVDDATTIQANRVDTGQKSGEYTVYAYTLVYNVTATEAGTITIKAGEAAAYIASVELRQFLNPYKVLIGRGTPLPSLSLL